MISIVSQRDVVLIKFPFSDRKDSKPRPVIVISNDNYNKKFDDFIAIPMTSRLVSRDHTMLITNKEMEEGKLVVDSLVKIDKISSLHQELIIYHIGRIKKQTYNELKKSLLNLI